MITKHEAAVLSSILQSPLSAMEIAEALANQSPIDRFWKQATIYSVLYSLEDKGLVEVDWKATTPDRAERRRRVYVANSTGRNMFRGYHATIQEALA